MAKSYSPYCNGNHCLLRSNCKRYLDGQNIYLQNNSKKYVWIDKCDEKERDLFDPMKKSK